jgi:hypothetical protein
MKPSFLRKLTFLSFYFLSFWMLTFLSASCGGCGGGNGSHVDGNGGKMAPHLLGVRTEAGDAVLHEKDTGVCIGDANSMDYDCFIDGQKADLVRYDYTTIPDDLINIGLAVKPLGKKGPPKKGDKVAAPFVKIPTIANCVPSPEGCKTKAQLISTKDSKIVSNLLDIYVQKNFKSDRKCAVTHPDCEKFGANSFCILHECTEDKSKICKPDCSNGDYCDDSGKTPICKSLLKNGDKCLDSGACESNICSGGVCVSKVNACTINDDCGDPGLICDSGKCVGKGQTNCFGVICDQNQSCNNDKIKPKCLGLDGHECIDKGQCASNYCNAGFCSVPKTAFLFAAQEIPSIHNGQAFNDYKVFQMVKIDDSWQVDNHQPAESITYNPVGSYNPVTKKMELYAVGSLMMQNQYQGKLLRYTGKDGVWEGAPNIVGNESLGGMPTVLYSNGLTYVLVRDRNMKLVRYKWDSTLADVNPANSDALLVDKEDILSGDVPIAAVENPVSHNIEAFFQNANSRLINVDFAGDNPPVVFIIGYGTLDGAPVVVSNNKDRIDIFGVSNNPNIFVPPPADAPLLIGLHWSTQDGWGGLWGGIMYDGNATNLTPQFDTIVQPYSLAALQTQTSTSKQLYGSPGTKDTNLKKVTIDTNAGTAQTDFVGPGFTSVSKLGILSEDHGAIEIFGACQDQAGKPCDQPITKFTSSNGMINQIGPKGGQVKLWGPSVVFNGVPVP